MKARATWHAAAAARMIAGAWFVGTAATARAAAPPAAPAAAQCNTVVVDSTSARVLGDHSAITKATAQLQAKGVDVRVRMLPSAPSGGLVAYRNAMVAACPSWSQNGAIRPNLLVFLVSLDHKDAIYYGSSLSGPQSQVDQVRTDMGSDFEAGQFDAGIAKGENEAYAALYPSNPHVWFDIVVWGVIIAVIVGLMYFLRYLGNRLNLDCGTGSGSSDSSFSGGGFDSGGGGGGGGDAGGSSGSW